MRYSFFSLIAMLIIMPVTVQAEDIVVESKVSSAIVYNDRATLSRVAQVDIPAGAHNLVFSGLPITIYTDSLRAQGQSKAKVIFGAVTHKRENAQDYIVPREKELNEQLVMLQDQNKVYAAEKRALEIGQKFLENIGKQAALRTNEDIAQINLNPENWGVASDHLSEKFEKNLKASLLLDFKMRDVKKKIQKTRNDLNQLRTGQKQSYGVSVPFESDKATRLTVELSYQIPNVGWTPIYDARLNTKSGEMNLVQYGSVWQRTGEDWSDVSLTLSTARPNRGASLPSLHPHWVSLYAHHPHRLRKAKREKHDEVNVVWLGVPEESADMAMSAAAPMEMMEEADAEFQSAQINTEGLVAEYDIPGLVDVSSDGTQAKILIGGFETENKLQTQIKPQLSSEAYLVVKAILKGDAPILPGQVSLFRDDAFIGKTHMKMLRPGDVEELAFGIDDNVRVWRNTLKDERSEAGLITKENILERHYVTQIQNLHKKPVQIAVLETVPVSKDERIRVDMLKEHTTQGYEADLHNMKGVTRWLMALEPSQKVKVNLGWKVYWPKGENISGL